jgi:hypothetical protein
LEWNLIQGVAVEFPGRSETDVGQADRSPGEEGSEARERKEPAEHNVALGVKSDIGESTAEKVDDDRGERATRLVNIAEDLGSIALLSEGSESSGTTVDARYTDGQHGDENDNVDEMVEAVQAGILYGKHERRGTISIRVGTE